MATMPRSPTSGKDIDAIARRLSETDFTSPAATWALLSSDYPQLGSNRLTALREALEVAINTSSDTAKTDFPLTPRVLQGLAYGAGSALSTGDGGDVPGLVDAPAAPSQYAAVYALCAPTNLDCSPSSRGTAAAAERFFRRSFSRRRASFSSCSVRCGSIAGRVFRR